MRNYIAEFVATFALVFAGPLTGASMNPARSLGPGLISGTFYGLWIYLTAPFLGALLAVPFCRLLRASDCEGETVKEQDLGGLPNRPRDTARPD